MTSNSPFSQALELLSRLVRVNSVNPGLVQEGVGEKEIAEFLYSF